MATKEILNRNPQLQWEAMSLSICTIFHKHFHYIFTFFLCCSGFLVFLAMAVYTGVTINYYGKRYGNWRFSWSYIIGWVSVVLTFFSGKYCVQATIPSYIRLPLFHKGALKFLHLSLWNHFLLNVNFFSKCNLLWVLGQATNALSVVKIKSNYYDYFYTTCKILM